MGASSYKISIDKRRVLEEISNKTIFEIICSDLKLKIEAEQIIKQQHATIS
jgi:hypothetical protein